MVATVLCLLMSQLTDIFPEPGRSPTNTRHQSCSGQYHSYRTGLRCLHRQEASTNNLYLLLLLLFCSVGKKQLCSDCSQKSLVYSDLFTNNESTDKRSTKDFSAL